MASGEGLASYRRSAHYPGDLAVGEAFLFIAKGNDQVLFVFADHEVMFGDTPRRVTDSRKLRLGAGTWSPYMLQNYANAVGLNLQGIKRFEEVYAERKKGKN